jgi:hypothetical protein
MALQVICQFGLQVTKKFLPTALLSSGSTRISSRPSTPKKEYRVFPVPNGDCKGLYVASKTPDSFEVRGLGGGTSNIRFDYRITAIRRKYETVRFADHTNDPHLLRLRARR